MTIAIRQGSQETFDILYSSPYLNPFQVYSDYHSRHWSAIKECVQSGNQNAVETLFARKDIPPVLIEAAAFQDNVSAAKHSLFTYLWILEHPLLNPNAINTEGDSLLEKVISFGSSAQVKSLLTHKNIDVNINSGAPLKLAKALSGQCKQYCDNAKAIVRLLEESGAK